MSDAQRTRDGSGVGIFRSKNDDASDEGVSEFHFVDETLYLCHEHDHYCPDGALPREEAV
ncbi:hypothetical protein [Streptomyces albipurpureus]|uniref:Uncharacterized protein n=1 Tax=Streptomyces albipurpureus TaxID=2897419 RepID=A0ABT0UT25_9ACTN|nr:hypothetical protein [Streptomyces sp. CWNU-1]MCM2391753.1 hypothetical protein [Streptomyces sp. CWNU-1]